MSFDKCDIVILFYNFESKFSTHFQTFFLHLAFGYNYFFIFNFFKDYMAIKKIERSSRFRNYFISD